MHLLISIARSWSFATGQVALMISFAARLNSHNLALSKILLYLFPIERRKDKEEKVYLVDVFFAPSIPLILRRLIAFG
jgi:hypothetical protein